MQRHWEEEQRIVMIAALQEQHAQRENWNPDTWVSNTPEENTLKQDEKKSNEHFLEKDPSLLLPSPIPNCIANPLLCPLGLSLILLCSPYKRLSIKRVSGGCPTFLLLRLYLL